MADDIGEFDLIARYLKPLATQSGAFNLQDDAAIIDVPTGKKLVMSKDILVGNVHFFSDDLPDLIARKALRTNISDIISKGADPAYYALGLCFPHKADGAFMEAFAQGLEADQDLYNLSLLGGDTTRSQNDFMISVTMFGLVSERGPVTRLNARPNEAIYVSGHLGSSSLGLLSLNKPSSMKSLSPEALSDLQAAYLLPQPPFGIQSIISDYASASMDISDGILADLTHLCRSSGVSAQIIQEHLPLNDSVKAALKKYPSLIKTAIKGGDDYQCLMTISRKREADFVDACKKMGHKVTRIGQTIERQDYPLSLLDHGAISAIPLDGYTHF